MTSEKEIIRKEEKNKWLIENRNVSFEQVAYLLSQGKYEDIQLHRNQEKYPGQMVIYLYINNIMHYVPFDIIDTKIIFRTIVCNNRQRKKFYSKKLYNE